MSDDVYFKDNEPVQALNARREAQWHALCRYGVFAGEAAAHGLVG